jgi:hypothetical protein
MPCLDSNWTNLITKCVAGAPAARFAILVQAKQRRFICAGLQLLSGETRFQHRCGLVACLFGVESIKAISLKARSSAQCITLWMPT